MKLTAEIKNQIAQDWLDKFPELGIYKPMWLLRRVGPLLVGICLNRDSGNDAYTPIFHVHNLGKSFPTVSLTLYDPLLTMKSKVPQVIKVAFHADHINEAANRMKEQLLIPLSGSVALDDVLSAYCNYMERPMGQYPLLLFEDILVLLLWCGRSKDAVEQFAEFSQRVAKWSPMLNVLQNAGGFNVWQDKCRSWIADPAQIRRTVNEQIGFHKLSKVPASDLIS
jgi:hypothetical protein